MDNIVDITYAVSEKEAQGRKRMKNLDTGEMWWEDPPVPAGYFDGFPNSPLIEHIEATVPEPFELECIPLNKEEPVVHVVKPLEFGSVIKPKGKKHGA